MKKFLEVSAPAFLEEGVIALSIKNNPNQPSRLYKFRFDKDPVKSLERFNTYYHMYFRNKGRFLNKIKEFQI